MNLSSFRTMVNRPVLFIFLCSFGCIQITAFAQNRIPDLAGPVVDEAGILSEVTESQLTYIIKAHEDSTSNQLAVLTLSTLGGEELEDYSLQVARTWELGQADRNNGVLVLVAVAERKIRIEVGYGLEGDVPDVTAKRIIDGEMTPYFRQGDFDNGVLMGVQAVLGTIEGTYEPAHGVPFDVTFRMRLIAGLLLMCVPVFIIGLVILRSRVVFWVTTAFVSTPIFMAGFIVFPPFGGFFSIGLVVCCLYVIRRFLRRSEKWSPILESVAQAKPGETVNIDMGRFNWSYTIPKASSGSRSSTGYSGFSSSSSSFSGGGGSFGGGGASGGW